jgi:hypothetical protein
VELSWLTELRTRNGVRTIGLLQAPDARDPLRLIVTPLLPEETKFYGLPYGVHPMLISSMLDAQQLDDTAYILIHAMVEAPR